MDGKLGALTRGAVRGTVVRYAYSTRLASLVAVAGSAMAQFQTEMSRSLTLSMAVFKNSPMIKIAETARCVALWCTRFWCTRFWCTRFWCTRFWGTILVYTLWCTRWAGPSDPPVQSGHAGWRPNHAPRGSLVQGPHPSPRPRLCPQASTSLSPCPNLVFTCSLPQPTAACWTDLGRGALARRSRPVGTMRRGGPGRLLRD